MQELLKKEDNNEDETKETCEDGKEDCGCN